MQAMRPLGARRGPRRLGIASPVVKGAHRTPRGNWLVGDMGTPDAEALAIDLVVGADPRRYL
jgi:hypothetical protein